MRLDFEDNGGWHVGGFKDDAGREIGIETHGDKPSRITISIRDRENDKHANMWLDRGMAYALMEVLKSWLEEGALPNYVDCTDDPPKGEPWVDRKRHALAEIGLPEGEEMVCTDMLEALLCVEEAMKSSGWKRAYVCDDDTWNPKALCQTSLTIADCRKVYAAIEAAKRPCG